MSKHAASSLKKESKIVTLPSQKSQRFRQNRQENSLDDISMTLNGIEARILNWSRTGVGFSLSKAQGSYQHGQLVTGVRIACGDIELYRGDIEIISLRSLQSDTISYGARFSGLLFPVDAVHAARLVNETARDMQRAIQVVAEVKPEFCQSVLVVTSALKRLKAVCDVEEEKMRLLPYDRKQEVEEVFLSEMSSKVSEILMSFNRQVGKIIDVEALGENSIYHEIVHDHIYPLYEPADLVKRAFEKPRGYAGDYEMMNQIYRSGFEGTSLFGRIMHNYIVHEASSESVKFRKPYFLGYYRELLAVPGTYNILSLASGPAVEVQEAIETWANDELERLRITLFDLDKEALEHAQTRIYDLEVRLGKSVSIEFINASVKSFLSANDQANETYDLIYSGGLFDYIENQTAGVLVKKLSSYLNPGGTLIIGNFTKANPTKAFCHLVTRWSLDHKTEQDMLNWAKGLNGFDIKIEFDPQRINAFLVAKKMNEST